jgi:hypothetical protein
VYKHSYCFLEPSDTNIVKKTEDLTPYFYAYCLSAFRAAKWLLQPLHAAADNRTSQHCEKKKASSFADKITEVLPQTLTAS